jgi:hypothetical protein
VVEIEEALERAHRWLRNQSWWSDEEDAIICVWRTDGAWVIGHTRRDLAETGEYLIGGYGPVVITDDGGIIPAENCVIGDFSMSERIAITFEKVADNEADEELRKKFQEIANAARESL